jgi:general secretion pathway protein A
MYTKFYGFNEKPFTLVPNPNYLYQGARHSHALAFLEYGLTEKIGFVMLTGEIGIGKTTLIRYLLNQVEADMDVAVIFNTNILSTDLITLILNEFEVKCEDGISKAKALETLYTFLIDKYAADRKVLLIIDEAQNLSDDVLEEIRMLSNLQTDEELLMQIMIVGQPDLRDKIQDPRLEQLAQRIAVSYHLSEMNREETGAYICHRLKKAGGDPDFFSEEVVDRIFEVSGGIPRTINLMCDAAFVYGYADGVKEISRDILDQVVEDKSGIGLFTKRNQVLPLTEPARDDARLCLLEEKTAKLEQMVENLTEKVDSRLKQAESRSDSCRDAQIADLKVLLAAERQRCAALEHKFGKYKGRHEFVSKIKQIK